MAFGARTRNVTRRSARHLRRADGRRLCRLLCLDGSGQRQQQHEQRAKLHKTSFRIDGVGYHRMAKMPAALLVRRLLYVLACAPARLGGGRALYRRRRMDAGADPHLVAPAAQAALLGLAIAGWYVWKYSRAERDADGRWLQRWAARALPFAVPLAVVLALVPRDPLRQLRGRRIRLVWIRQPGAPLAERHSAGRAAVGAGFLVAEPRVDVFPARIPARFRPTARSCPRIQRACRC